MRGRNWLSSSRTLSCAVRLRTRKVSHVPDVTYEIVQHDGGWAYKVNGVFSETFSTHAEALAAARVASAEQEIPGHTETIEYEDDKGKWHTETARGRDRPHTVVKDVD
jgi:Uncharacterized protein conserved in bacteria (DUF2188)